MKKLLSLLRINMKKLFLLMCLILNFVLFSNDPIVVTNNEYIVIAKDNIAKVYSFKKMENFNDALYNSYPIYKLDHGTLIKSLLITFDSKYIITIGGKYVYIWKLGNGKLLARL